MPGFIIADEVFFDGSAMTADQVQTFLNQKVSACQDGYTCLKDYRQPTPDVAADAYCDAYVGSPDERASDIIAKVGAACDVSQKAILVTLQKEMSLVTHTWPSDWRFDRAMGYACPDTVPVTCNPDYAGFFYQVYLAARQFQRYSAPETSYHWYPIGAISPVRYSTNTACGSPVVFIENRATAALYYYTPYQPNAAALANLSGTGDGCSAYGNRNFWKFYWDWFGSPYGASVPTVAITGPDTLLEGNRATLNVSLDPSISGRAALQHQRPGGAWGTSTTTVSIVNGVGSVSFGQSAPEMSYRVVYRGGISNSIDMVLVTSTVAITGPETLVPGDRATLDVVVDPTTSGTGTLQYQYPDGAWKTSSTKVPIVNGVGSVSFGQSAPEMSYRVVFAGAESNVLTIDLASPSVTITGPDTLVPGDRATLDVVVDPTTSRTGALQYQYPDGEWKTSSATVPIVDGIGSVSFGQSAPEMSYRVVVAGGVSNVVTIDLATPTVTIDGPTTLAPGGRATLDVSVDPASSGTGALQYQYPDGAWKTSRTTVSISNGTGSVSFGQSAPEMSYRVVFAGGTSNVITIDLATPTVTIDGPTTLAPGGRATLDVSVDPASSGTGKLQYQYPDGAWKTSRTTVSISNGWAR